MLTQSQVCSLVSQRDNEISYATAVSQQRIAEAAQRDGSIMKQLARDSGEVTLRAWRDGVNTRIMTIVTMLTLPGTFTAVSSVKHHHPSTTDITETLFSTSFFDFQPSDQSSMVSPWVWLYVVVTIGFTLVFLAFWYFATKAITGKFGDTNKPWTGLDMSKDEETDQLEKLTDLGSPTKRASPTTATTDAIPQTTSFQCSSYLGKAGRSEGVPPGAIGGQHPSRLEHLDFPSQSIPGNTFPPERAYWDASSTMGTNSYKRCGRACAMCGAHVD